MTQQSFEQRVATAIDAYADLAPTEVDDVMMARLAAARSRRIGPVWFGNVPDGRGLAVLIATLALLVTMLTGAFMAGTYLRDRGHDGIFAERVLVEPYTGLPPDGTAPSTPETGELLVSFFGRPTSIGLDFHRMWLYADGRLIWIRNLDYESGYAEGLVTAAQRAADEDLARPAFGGGDPISAVIEQLLTPEGIELLRSEVLATARALGPAGTNDDMPGGPGVLWGGLTIRVDDQLSRATWSDYDLPGRLATPASWLPARAWADQRIGAYVPYRYAVCAEDATDTPLSEHERSRTIDLLPGSTKDLIRSSAIEPAPGWNEHDPRCAYLVSTEDARVIAATLDGPPLQRESGSSLRYRIPVGLLPRDQQPFVELLPVLPDGGTVCNCG